MKTLPKKQLKKWMILLLGGCLTLAWAGCNDAGDDMEDAGEATMDAAEEVGDAAKDAADDAGDAMEDAADDAGDAMEDAADDVRDEF